MYIMPVNGCDSVEWIDTVCTYIVKSFYLYDPVRHEILVHTTGGSESLDTWGKVKAPAPTHTCIAIHVTILSWKFMATLGLSSDFIGPATSWNLSAFWSFSPGRWLNTCKQGSHFGSLSWWCDDTWTLGILRVIFHQLLYQNSAKLGVLLHVGLNYKRTLESHMKSDSFSRI